MSLRIAKFNNPDKSVIFARKNTHAGTVLRYALTAPSVNNIS